VELITLIKDLCNIPAPSNYEEKRAEFIKNWLIDIGAEGVYIDDALNVVYPINCNNSSDIVLFVAHTDTVFPDTEPMPLFTEGDRMYCPGIGDDTANLAMMLYVVKYIVQNKLKPSRGIIFSANSGEEGLGNLKGIRKLMEDYKGRISEVISFDLYYGSVVSKAVGSSRFKVEVLTEGGHSFSNFGNENAIHVLSSIINDLYSIEVPKILDSQTTYNVGEIKGGTSVNTIAQQAEMLYEYRSDNAECIDIMKEHFEYITSKYRKDGFTVNVQSIGERPCMRGVDKDKHLALIKRCRHTMKKHLGEDAKLTSASTDCNIPLSLGIPAVCIGLLDGGGVHTREEWISIKSLEIGKEIAFDIIFDYFQK